MPAPATATTALEAPAQGSDDKGAAEIVVTGSLIRGQAPVGSPLVSVTTDDIKTNGSTNPREVLANLPELSNFNQSVRPQTGGAQGGTFAPSIRGLPTLTLINSHRVVGVGTLGTQADPNSIPSLALERVEVVPDGASATYGSDAVGGVVNFITRRKFDGLEASARYGIADSYRAYDAGLVAGKSWQSGSLVVAYQFTKSSNLTGLDRPDYVLSDLRPYGGTDNRSNTCDQPNVTIGGVNYAAPAFTAGTTNRCEKQREADLLPADRRHAVFASVRQELGDRVTAWAEGNYSNHLQLTRVVPFNVVTTIPNTNPYFQAIPGATGTSETVSFTASNLLPRSFFVSRANQNIYGADAGADVKLTDRWSLHAFANYGYVSDDAPEAISLNQTALAAAANGTTAATALDAFGTRTAPATLAAIGNFLYSTNTVQKLKQAVATVDGPLFKLPGGDLKIAAGGEVRQETFDSVFYNGPVGSPVAGAASGKRTVYSAFGELAVPIVGEDNAFTAVRSLTLSAAVRYDHYSDFGSTTNPKVGLDWTIVDGLKLRGSWGQSFLAPSLGDLHAIDGKFVTAGSPAARNFLGNDPLINGEYNSYVVAGGNPNLKAQTAKTFSLGADVQPRVTPGLLFRISYYNVKFKNLITVPSAAGGSIFTNPAFAQFIVRNPTAAQIAAYSAGIPAVLSVPLVPGLPTTLFDLRRQNLAARNTDGLDFQARYAWSGALGRFTVSAAANRVLTSDQIPAPGSAPTDQLLQGQPKWRGRGEVDWSLDQVRGQVAVNYAGQYTNQTVVSTGQIQFELPAVVTADVYLSYTLGGKGLVGGTELSVNVRNIFNQKPPIGPAGPRADVDVVGRIVYLGIRKRW